MTMCYKWVENDALLDGLNLLPCIPRSGLILNRPDLLLSALDSPKNHYCYNQKPIELFDLAAIYASSINRNHPFADGNKRASYCAVVIFLEINGYRLNANHQERIRFFFRIAKDKLDRDVISEWIKNNSIKK